MIIADRARRGFTKDPKRFPPVLSGLRDTRMDIRVQANPDCDNRFNLAINIRFANVATLKSSACDTNIIYTRIDYTPRR